MNDWDEIKRLAADFQKIQLSSTTQKLSERNCIEIVSWLIEKKMLDLIFTADGKEYLTPTQLISDIRGELYVSGGRVNLVDLAKTIGVDLNHINNHVTAVTKGQRDIVNVLGQLIDSTYVTRIAGEINEKLSQQGMINVNDLTLQYDLPTDFLQQQVMERHLGKLIFGKQDKTDARVFFTESFIARTKAKIRGALIGLTKPTPITVILSNADISEKLFFSLFDQASMFGSLTSRMAGAQYIPNIYSRSQNEWVHNFYKQNNYLEFDALSRLGITDHKSYLKKHTNFDELIFLNSCAVSKRILERLEADIDECISSKSYLDLQNNVPTVFNENDIKMLVGKVLKSAKQKETVIIDNYILSRAFIDTLIKDCNGDLEEKAKEIVESGKYQQFQTDQQVGAKMKGEGEGDDFKADKREERRKKASAGKSGGGSQGRETKTKSTKKGGAKNKPAESSDYEPEQKATLQIMSVENIVENITIVLESEGLDDLIDSVAQFLHPILNEMGLAIAAKIYHTTVADRTASRRQTHNDVQNKLNALFGDIRLFEKGIKLLPMDLQTQLYKYILKSLCTDFVNEILNYISAEEGSNVLVDAFNNDQRLKFINGLKAEYKVPLLLLNKTLSSGNVDDFMDTADKALESCSMILMKIDKKKDRLTILNHKHALLEQLDKCDDPPLVLHLATLIIFISATQCMVHASGRHVASLLSFVKQFLTPEQNIELTSYHDMVTMVLSGSNDVETAKERLQDKLSTIKQVANDFKKPVIEKS